jgi:hypothetical protein
MLLQAQTGNLMIYIIVTIGTLSVAIIEATIMTIIFCQVLILLKFNLGISSSL